MLRDKLVVVNGVTGLCLRDEELPMVVIDAVAVCDARRRHERTSREDASVRERVRCREGAMVVVAKGACEW